MFSLSEDVVSKSKILGKLWQAAHCHGRIEDGEAQLPDICHELDSWVGSEHVNPRKRMSLRTSAVLIDGAAKVYRRRMEQLLQDVDQLDRDIITRRRNKSNDDAAFTDTSSTSRSASTPEEMMRQSGNAPEMFNVSITNDINRRKSSIKYPLIDHSLSSCTEPSTSPTEQAVDKKSDFQQTQVKNKHEATESGEKPTSTTETDKSDQGPDGSTPVVGSKRRTNTKTTRTGESKSTCYNDEPLTATKSSPGHGSSPKRPKGNDRSIATESDRSGNTGPDLNKSFMVAKAIHEISDENEAGGKTPSVKSFVFGNSTHWRKIGEMSIKRRNPKDIRKTPSRRDQGSQTCFPIRGRTSETETEGFDMSLPIGYLLIHDHYGSRVPSKIVICSLNPQVKDLVCS